MRGMNFSALVSSIETVNRSPRVWEGPLNPTTPAPSTATSASATTVRSDRPIRQATFFAAARFFCFARSARSSARLRSASGTAGFGALGRLIRPTADFTPASSRWPPALTLLRSRPDACRAGLRAWPGRLTCPGLCACAGRAAVLRG